MLKIDLDRLIKELQPRHTDRKKTSLYLSKSVYQDFQKTIFNLPAGTVIEMLMEEWIKASKKVNKG